MTATQTAVASGHILTPSGESAVSPAPFGQDYYDRQISELRSDAFNRKELEEFVESVCWVLGWTVAHFDRAWIAGDILKRIGWHTQKFVDRKQAEEELKDLKQSGASTN